MDRTWYYEIQVEDELPERWKGWFEGLAINIGPGGNTVLNGVLVDQAALHGVLDRIRDLNLMLLSVERTETGLDDNQGPTQ